jgi:hypothetical protein
LNSSKEEVRQEDILPSSKYFEILNDLVESRNVVAHGSHVDKLLSFELLNSYAEYILRLIGSIHPCLMDVFFTIMVRKGIAIEIGNPIKVYNKRIVCFNSENKHIRRGYILIGKNSENVCCWGNIESMQLCGQDIDEISEEISEDIGVKVSFTAKDNYTYFLYPFDIS